MHTLYYEFIFRPLYNGLVGIIDLFPYLDLGLAVIIFTIILRLILFPLSKSALLTQVKMKEAEPEINKLKAQYSTDRQTQAIKVMELYKEKNIKPFSGVLLLFIQLPILLALISVFYKIAPGINPDHLYGFIGVPEVSNTLFGMSLATKSIILALITAISQFLQLHYSLASKQYRAHLKKNGGQQSQEFSAQLAHSMNSQMKYFLPFIAFVSVYWIIPAQFPQAASIIAIYWSITSLFTLAQELVIRKRYLKDGTFELIK